MIKTEIDLLEITKRYLDTSLRTRKHCEKNLRSNPSSSACGKAIIVGEHAVVYGAKAIAIPLKDLRVELTVNPKIKRQNKTANKKSLPLTNKQKQLNYLISQRR